MNLLSNIKGAKSIFSDSMFVFAANIIQKITSLFVIYFLVRFFTQEQFGQYQLVLTSVAILRVFALPGLSNAIMQSTARGKAGTYLNSLKVSIVFGALGGLALLGIGLWQQFYLNSGIYAAFYLAASLFIFHSGLRKWRSVKTGQQKFPFLLKIDSTFEILTALLTVAVCFAFPNNFMGALLVVLLMPSIQNIFMTFSVTSDVKKSKESAEEGSVSYGLKTTLYSGANIIANQIDKLLIYGFVSPAALALYFVAERMSELTKTVGQNVAAVLAPRFAKTKTYSKQLDRNLNIFTICLGASIILFAFTLLPWTIEILFGETYKAAIPYAQALLCTVAIGNHASLRNRFVNSKLDEKSNREITLSISLIRIISSAALIPFFGILGAVISSFIYRISTVAIMHYIMKTRYQ